MTVNEIIHIVIKEHGIYGLNEIHIIDLSENKVHYGGRIEGYMLPDESMIDYKKEVDAKEVKKSLYNHKILYIFV